MDNKIISLIKRYIPYAILTIIFLYSLFLLIYLFYTNSNLKYLFLIVFFMICIIIVLYYFQVKKTIELKNKLFKYSDDLEKAIERSNSIELNRKKQEFITLQSQINPHFLYNTLDTFRGIALEREAYELVEMIGTLSSMLKYSVNYDGEMVSLNAELSYLNNYLKIQKLRFPNRFEYTKKIEIDPNELLITMCPRLIIQPIIENSIRHGFEDMTNGGKLSVHVYTNNEEVIIEVSDNGKGIQQEEVNKINRLFEYPEERIKRKKGDGGLGINNVNDRIKMYCGKEYGLHFRSTEGKGTQVEIRMPRKFH